jgi:hypothetical protein
VSQANRAAAVVGWTTLALASALYLAVKLRVIPSD